MAHLGTLLALIFACASAQPIARASSSHHAECPPPYGPKDGFCLFAIGGADFRNSQTGKGSRLAERTRTSFTVPLENDERIVGLSVLSAAGTVTLIAETSAGETGRGVITSLDTTSLSTRWQAFNLSVGVAEGTALYIAGIGLVPRVDLETGSIRWQHSDLYEPDTNAFNSFLSPEVGSVCVVIREERDLVPGLHSHSVPREVVVHKAIGTLIEGDRSG